MKYYEFSVSALLTPVLVSLFLYSVGEFSGVDSLRNGDIDKVV